MKLILVGCEHVGKTTLSEGVSAWLAKTMGNSRSFHDHFTIPTPELSDEDLPHFMAMSPAFKERFQRYQIQYHAAHGFLGDADHLLVGYHLEEAVFAPLYYGYGGEGQYADRTAMARAMEKDILEVGPDTILVLLTARADVIRQRMKTHPMPRDQRGHRPGLLLEKDVERVLDRFESEFKKSLIRKKFVIDNSDMTPEETLREFTLKVQKLLSPSDRLRILAHRALLESGDAVPGVVEHIKTRPEKSAVGAGS